MAEIPTADWSWINAAAERFECAWKDGERPRIEEFLIKVPEPQWPALLQELMRVEGELRRRAGEEPSAEEYRRRFPEHESVIRADLRIGPGCDHCGGPGQPVGATRATSASRPPAGSPPPRAGQPPRLRDRPRAGRRRHGRRLPRPQPPAGPPRGPQGHRPAHRRATRRARPLPEGDPRRRPVAASQRRERLLGVPVRHQSRLRHGVRRGAGPAADGQGQGADAHRPRLLFRPAGGAGAAARARGGDGPSRHQAREPDALAPQESGRDQGPRLRPVQGGQRAECERAGDRRAEHRSWTSASI